MRVPRVSRAAIFLLASLAPASIASAELIGTLRITSDPGDVIVTATRIDWTPPQGGPDGTFTVGAGSTLTYDGGVTLPIGSGGSILDLDLSTTVFPVNAFMTFDLAPGVAFDLGQVGPGPANTVCSDAFDPNGPACAVFAGSPFTLRPTTIGTELVLSGGGTATDNLGDVSVWSGAFRTQIAGRTPFDIQQNLLGGGAERFTYLGEFITTFEPTPTPIPEPSTSSLLLVSAALGGLRWRRRRSAR